MIGVTEFIKEFKKGGEILDLYRRQLSEGMIQWVIENEGDQSVEKYFSDPVGAFDYMFRLLHKSKLTLEERKDNYEKLKPLITRLTETFKFRVKEMNRRARFQGFENHIELTLASNGIRKKDFKSFLKNVDSFISLVQSDFPATKINTRISDWSEVSVPAPEALVNLHALPGFKSKNKKDGIIELISKYDPRMSKYKDRIKIKFGKPEDFYGSSARYVDKKKIARITVANYVDGLARDTTLVHEVGHALDMLECEENRVIYTTIDRFIKEYSAVEFEHKFVKRVVPERDQKLIRYNFLNGLFMVLFEIDIFTNDDQDFDEAYAKAINRCFPNARQDKNPLYVFDKDFFFRPLDGLLYCIAGIDMYLKDAKKEARMKTHDESN